MGETLERHKRAELFKKRLQRQPPSRHATRKGLTGKLRGLRVAAAFLCFSWMLYGQQSTANEYQIKATYLYDFSRFVEWPAQPATGNQPFGICVLGTDPFGQALDAVLSGERVGARDLVARRISNPQEAGGCQILFVSASEQKRLKDILTALNNSSVLTVSDIPAFSEHGGMIGFVVDSGKVRFEVNLKRASDAGLTLSADLLKVAVSVRRDS